MSQILNIFRKDARHYWPEILVSIALLTTFVVEQPRKWAGESHHNRLLTGLSSALVPAMILAWAFLIIRLVQSETLVGDRQFWITRPYEWHKLLAAKILSILIFIHLPLFVSQIVLLWLAQFPVLASVTGLLYVHLLLFIALVLPSLTIGSFTSGIGQTALTLLLICLAFLGLIAVMFTRPDMDFATDATDWLQETIYLSACLSVIFLQYAYRRTLLARCIAGAGLILIALVITFAPYEKLIGGWFPAPAQANPIPSQFKLDRRVSFAHPKDWTPSKYEEDLDLEFPLAISDLSEKSLIEIRGVKLELDLPDGNEWTSHWHSAFNKTISYGRTYVWPEFTIKKDVFQRIKDSQIRARVTLGLNVYKLGVSSESLLADNRLSLPGDTRCVNVLAENLMHCFSALKGPDSLFVVAHLPNSSCPITNNADREPWASSPASFASLGGSSTPDLNFTPIQQFDLTLSRYFIHEDLWSPLPVCSGTHLLINKPQFLYSVRDEVDLGQIVLANYHPTYPRMIIPPLKRLTPDAPPDTLSRNIGAEILPVRVTEVPH